MKTTPLSASSETVRKFRRATRQVDSPRPKYTKSSQFKFSQIQKVPGKYEEILFFRLPARCVNGTFARQWSRFTMKMNCCSRHAEFTLSYAAENSWKVSGNEFLTYVLPYIDGTLRVSHWSTVSRRGFFLPHKTTLCLPRTFARQRPSTRQNWVILKSARSAHTTEHATHGTRELAQTGAPAGFFKKSKLDMFWSNCTFLLSVLLRKSNKKYMCEITIWSDNHRKYNQ